MMDSLDAVPGPVVGIFLAAAFAVASTAGFGLWKSKSVRRLLAKHLTVSHLDCGQYQVLASCQKVTDIGHVVYDWSSTVTDGRRQWTVVSQRPLPDTFVLTKYGIARAEKAA